MEEGACHKKVANVGFWDEGEERAVWGVQWPRGETEPDFSQPIATARPTVQVTRMYGYYSSRAMCEDAILYRQLFLFLFFTHTNN